MQAALQNLALAPRLAGAALACGAILVVTGFLWGQRGWEIPGAMLALGLAWLAFIDIDRLLLPDVLTIGLLFAGLGFSLALEPETIFDHVIGALGGYAALAITAAFYRRTRGREGLGMGDAKLFAVGGAWLGWVALPLVLLVASIAALVFVVAVRLVRGRSKGSAFPFGPFIAGAIWLVWLLPVKQLPVLGLIGY